MRECVNSCNIAHARRSLYVLPVGRQDFSLVYPEIRIIEGQIIEVLLHKEFCVLVVPSKCKEHCNFNAIFTFSAEFVMFPQHTHVSG